MIHRILKFPIAALWLALTLLVWSPARAAGLTLPPAAQRGLNLLYGGQAAAAMADFEGIVASNPNDPLGYLLEAEARWWQIYCESCEVKFNMIDAWEHRRSPDDDTYLMLTAKAIQLADSGIAQKDSATMELYAGIGLLLQARLLGLRDDRRGTARAGVQGRAHLLRCLQLDPEMADAYTGLGLYNYYVDTLSALAKVLRVFMGIPGGKKSDGVRQLRIGMQQGALTRVEARFYLARNLRNYDHDYADSIQTMTPLTEQYPMNPVFKLLLADTQSKLGRQDLATAAFRDAASLPIEEMACAMRVHELARQALALLSSGASHAGP